MPKMKILTVEVYPFNQKSADLTRAIMHMHTMHVKVETRYSNYEPYLIIMGRFVSEENAEICQREIENRKDEINRHGNT
jgi:cell division protein FtsN